MDKVKIKRVKRPKKLVTIKEKTLAALGLGITFMGGGAGAVKPSQPQTRIVSTVKNAEIPRTGLIKATLFKIFGVKTAQAAFDTPTARANLNEAERALNEFNAWYDSEWANTDSGGWYDEISDSNSNKTNGDIRKEQLVATRNAEWPSLVNARDSAQATYEEAVVAESQTPPPPSEPPPYSGTTQIPPLQEETPAELPTSQPNSEPLTQEQTVELPKNMVIEPPVKAPVEFASEISIQPLIPAEPAPEISIQAPIFLPPTFLSSDAGEIVSPSGIVSSDANIQQGEETFLNQQSPVEEPLAPTLGENLKDEEKQTQVVEQRATETQTNQEKFVEITAEQPESGKIEELKKAIEAPQNQEMGVSEIKIESNVLQEEPQETTQERTIEEPQATQIQTPQEESSEKSLMPQPESNPPIENHPVESAEEPKETAIEEPQVTEITTSQMEPKEMAESNQLSQDINGQIINADGPDEAQNPDFAFSVNNPNFSVTEEQKIAEMPQVASTPVLTAQILAYTVHFSDEQIQSILQSRDTELVQALLDLQYQDNRITNDQMETLASFINENKEFLSAKMLPGSILAFMAGQGTNTIQVSEISKVLGYELVNGELVKNQTSEPAEPIGTDKLTETGPTFATETASFPSSTPLSNTQLSPSSNFDFSTIKNTFATVAAENQSYVTATIGGLGKIAILNGVVYDDQGKEIYNSATRQISSDFLIKNPSATVEDFELLVSEMSYRDRAPAVNLAVEAATTTSVTSNVENSSPVLGEIVSINGQPAWRYGTQVIFNPMVSRDSEKNLLLVEGRSASGDYITLLKVGEGWAQIIEQDSAKNISNAPTSGRTAVLLDQWGSIINYLDLAVALKDETGKIIGVRGQLPGSTEAFTFFAAISGQTQDPTKPVVFVNSIYGQQAGSSLILQNNKIIQSVSPSMERALEYARTNNISNYVLRTFGNEAQLVIGTGATQRIVSFDANGKTAETMPNLTELAKETGVSIAIGLNGQSVVNYGQSSLINSTIQKDQNGNMLTITGKNTQGDSVVLQRVGANWSEIIISPENAISVRLLGPDGNPYMSLENVEITRDESGAIREIKGLAPSGEVLTLIPGAPTTAAVDSSQISLVNVNNPSGEGRYAVMYQNNILDFVNESGRQAWEYARENKLSGVRMLNVSAGNTMASWSDNSGNAQFSFFSNDGKVTEGIVTFGEVAPDPQAELIQKLLQQGTWYMGDGVFFAGFKDMQSLYQAINQPMGYVELKGGVGGFYLSGEILNYWIDNVINLKGLSPVTQPMFALLESEGFVTKLSSGKYQLVESVKKDGVIIANPDSLNHEYTHKLFETNPEYQREAFERFKQLPLQQQVATLLTLKAMGYEWTTLDYNTPDQGGVGYQSLVNEFTAYIKTQDRHFEIIKEYDVASLYDARGINVDFEAKLEMVADYLDQMLPNHYPEDGYKLVEVIGNSIVAEIGDGKFYVLHFPPGTKFSGNPSDLTNFQIVTPLLTPAGQAYSAFYKNGISFIVQEVGDQLGQRAVTFAYAAGVYLKSPNLIMQVPGFGTVTVDSSGNAKDSNGNIVNRDVVLEKGTPLRLEGTDTIKIGSNEKGDITVKANVAFSLDGKTVTLTYAHPVLDKKIVEVRDAKGKTTALYSVHEEINKQGQVTGQTYELLDDKNKPTGAMTFVPTGNVQGIIEHERNSLTGEITLTVRDNQGNVMFVINDKGILSPNDGWQGENPFSASLNQITKELYNFNPYFSWQNYLIRDKTGTFSNK